MAGHVKRMGDEKLAKRSDAQKGEGKGGEEDQECDGRMRDMERVGEEWGTTAKEGVGDCMLKENIVREK